MPGAASCPDLAALLAGDGGLPGTVLAVLPAGDAPQDAAGLAAGVLRLLQDWLAEPCLDGAHLAVVTTGAVAAGPATFPAFPTPPPGAWSAPPSRRTPAGSPSWTPTATRASDAAIAAALDHARAHGEPEVALRHGTAYTPRLTPAPTSTGNDTARFNADGTVLVTGGTGMVGGLVARHLVSGHGVRHVLLASRGGLGAPGAEALGAELAGLGASVTIAACDIGSQADVDALIASVPGEHPLTAVFHAAGVLGDGTVESLTAQDVAAVFRPKVGGADNLHRATRDLDLDAFVLFSSAAATLASPGQASYAAANAYLDALAQQRRGLGLPAVSLAWGLWEQASGMTGHLGAVQRARMARAGMAPLATGHALALLDAALGLDEPLLLLAPLAPAADPAERPALLRDLPGDRVPRAAARAAVAGQGDALAGRMAALAPDERRQYLLGIVREQVAAVLGHAAAGTVDTASAFKDLGFDSLTAVELPQSPQCRDWAAAAPDAGLRLPHPRRPRRLPARPAQPGGNRRPAGHGGARGVRRL